MQKLQLKLKNVPTNASQVRCSTNSGLNKEEILSDQNGLKNNKLDCNSPDENLQQHRAGQKLRLSDIVYVLNMRGQPLMPCKHKTAKRLLKKKKAKVVKRLPFTIQLTFATGETKQDITLGIDPGFQNVGISAVTKKKELFNSEVKLRINISNLLKEKAMYRRGRRNKLQYRPARWNNRANARKKGRLMPSVKHKLDTHINLINRVKKFLPITKVVVEVCNFDIQKIKNPAISGVEYQEGRTKGFENVKTYVLSRDMYTCQYCKKSKNLKFNVHHIKHRGNGGTDMPDNLITLCEKCHKNYHNGKIKLNVKITRGFKLETIISTIKNKIVEQSNSEVTFGYITKLKRIDLGLEKTHSNDAFVIAGGSSQERVLPVILIQKQRNNRSIQQNRKGQKPAIRKQRYKIQTKDIIYIDDKPFISKGCQNLGTRVAYNDNGKNKTVKIEKIDRFYNYGGFYAEV